MATQGASTVVPRLRFPEFRGTVEWAVNDLVGVANFINDKIAVSKLHPRDYISTENLLPGYGETVVSTKLPEVASVTRFERDDVLISNIRPYLKKVWRADRNGGASNDIIVVRAKPLLSEAFLSLILRNDAFIAYVMESAKGVKMPRGDVDAMREYPVAYPEPAEQRKIADCLTSLDEVIAAQGRKVEALKAHKRGLMQQLFPRKGETRPRLRFPEFRNAPEWERKTLKQLAKDFLDGDWIESKDQSSSGIRLVQTGNVGVGELLPKPANARYISEATFDRLNCTEVFAGDCLVSRLPDPVGRACLVPDGPERMITAVDCTIIRFDSLQIVPSVFVSYSQTDQYSRAVESLSSGSTRTRISRATLGSVEVPLPELQEQQRIADCLSALDTQIAAESKQLAALKTHKRGLMQQLFPAPEGD